MLESVFQLKKFNTDIKTEVLAGVTTFLTMAYIIVVNPGILSAAGIPKEPSTVATIIASIAGCLVMAFYANRPIAVAPYMGENAFIAFTVVLGMQKSWQAGITCVFIGGLLFIAITAFKLRSWLARAVPINLKYAFVVGIGLFLTFIGLVDTGIVAKSPSPDVPVMVGKLISPEVILAVVALLLMSVLMIRKLKGALIIGILGATVLAFAGKALGWDLPDVHSPNGFFSLPPSISPIMFQFRFAEVFALDFLPILLTVFLMDFVDTMGTLIGVSARA